MAIQTVKMRLYESVILSTLLWQLSTDKNGVGVWPNTLFNSRGRGMNQVKSCRQWLMCKFKYGGAVNLRLPPVNGCALFPAL